MSIAFTDPKWNGESTISITDDNIVSKIISFGAGFFKSYYFHLKDNGQESKDNVLILSHNDSDGHGSSAVIGLWEKYTLNNNITVYNMDGYTFDYSTIKDKMMEADVIYITDLSLNEKQIDYIMENSKGVIVWIDHHISSNKVPDKDPNKLHKIIRSEDGISAAGLCQIFVAVMNKLVNKFYSDTIKEPSVSHNNDFLELADRLSMFLLTRCPTIIKMISLYDTFHDDMDLRFQYGLQRMNMNINSDDGLKFWTEALHSTDMKIIGDIINTGEIIKEYLDSDWARMRKSMIIELPVTIVTRKNGKNVKEHKDLVAMNDNGFSMIFGNLLQERDGCIRYYQKGDGTWSYGIYASKHRKTSIDCEQFASHFHGGGHKTAAGWSNDFNTINQMYSTVKKDGRVVIHMEDD